MSDQREQTRKQMGTAGLWGLMNCLKREGDSQRATIAKGNGIDPATLPGMGNEIPFGNVTISQQSSPGSSLGKFTQAAVLALAAGAAGFGLHNLMKEPEAETIQPPPPVNAVIEWEITPNGEFRSDSEGAIEFHTESSESSSG